MKGHATKVACDAYGSMVLVAILDLVDDTEMLNKFIVSELANNVEKVAFDRHGRRLFLHLLSPQKSHYISVDALTALQIRNDSFEEEKDAEDGEVLEGSSLGSKKDSFVRRRELLQSSCLGEDYPNLQPNGGGWLILVKEGLSVAVSLAEVG
ncbi:hypothetical protein L7F22_060607 [Adiantum nelumboides]|nr:hypothetical protein [Adiantum nelumboides]